MLLKQISFAICLSFVALSHSAFAEEWSQWRGPNRDGRVADTNWPDALNGSLELVWERPHAPSYSGPVLQDGKVFTTETIDKTTERVTAYDLTSGEQVWTSQWPGSMAVPFFAASNGSWIRSTPACDKNNLIVLGMRDVLVNLDPATGDEKWRIDFVAKFGDAMPAFGAVCSPVIDGDAVYVQTGGALVKLSLSGEVLWKTLENGEGMMSSGAFSSPTIAELAGKRQLVVQTRQELCGVDLDSGSVLWRQSIEAFRGMNILTPLVIGDEVFTSAHSGRAQLFSVGRSDDQWTITEKWAQKTQAYMSSPIVVNDAIYLHMKNQRVCAMSIADGSIRWTSSPHGKYWSMIGSGDKVLALDNGGDLFLIQASDKELNVIDKFKVANDAWAHLALSGEHMIVRDLNSLKVFRWSK